MRIGLACFSRRGQLLGVKVASYLKSGSETHDISMKAFGAYAGEQPREKIGEWTGRMFTDCDALIFIGACGIAVRSIAPFIRSKLSDPAVIVIDETGRFCISLLSGHLGGANELAARLADVVGAQPVITTATDGRGRLSPDIFARLNGCRISDMEMAKRAAAWILEKEHIEIYTDRKIGDAQVPEEVEVHTLDELRKREDRDGNDDCVIVISPYLHDGRILTNALWLIPEDIHAGVGCRRGVSADRIEQALCCAMQEEGLDMEGLASVASIDLKQDEEGLLEACRRLGVEGIFFNAGELSAVQGSFTASNFVMEMTGVDNVCERSALCAASKGCGEYDEPYLLKRKTSGNGVTTALAGVRRRLIFE